MAPAQTDQTRAEARRKNRRAEANQSDLAVRLKSGTVAHAKGAVALATAARPNTKEAQVLIKLHVPSRLSFNRSLDHHRLDGG
ncbi:hypothetical protein CU103_22295 [Phyllobacterium sophorae]|uniref:Uncharacterized protein n=1 Tax=Phyllobacterium sophorae TaxID=1520277 RepID=A0A2P7B548_9HYPH|nr:hypothetical protein CU103_22295 [Phyllobacterium sophorae]